MAQEQQRVKKEAERVAMEQQKAQAAALAALELAAREASEAVIQPICTDCIL